VGTRGSVVQIFKQFIAEDSKELPITDIKMTRFWITLDQAVNFVLKSFQRMRGGEIFVPKIPSIRLIDLAKAMAPKLNHKIIGIRPGEKLHEKMCSINESYLTLAFKDHYVIKPSIQFYDKKINFSKNKLNEISKPVSKNFEYRSDTNTHFLTVQEIIKLNKDLIF
jgi:UDP-N-acetylglucosamine 4,6-dehydratase